MIVDSETYAYLLLIYIAEKSYKVQITYVLLLVLCIMFVQRKEVQAMLLQEQFEEADLKYYQSFSVHYVLERLQAQICNC